MEGVILMETIIIVVYKDTINHKYNGDNNLSCIKVTREFAELYYLERVNKEDFKSFESFINNYTADATEDFYEYAKEYNAIIDIEDM